MNEKAAEIDKRNEELKLEKEGKTDKKDSYWGLQKRIRPYTTPRWAMAVAGTGALLTSFGLPLLGIIVISNVFALMNPDPETAADLVFRNVQYLGALSLN